MAQEPSNSRQLDQPPVSDFDSFAEFYPFYLREHSRPGCRRLHFVGTSLAIGCVLAAALTWNGW